MKKAICLLLLFASILVISGCDSSYEISGLENFSENTCAFGLNDRLLPSGAQFIASNAHEDGNYYYWTDGNYLQAKTIVWLQYSEPNYQLAKAFSQACYNFSPTHYNYENFVFSEARTDESEYNFRGIQMLGYSDATCTLIFIGYVNYASDKYKTITECNFVDFFNEEFRPHLNKTGDGLREP